MKIVTCVAPVNIAVIKYWGKRDEELILPINDSISGTLSIDNMCAKTTILASPDLKENNFWLNGVKQNLDNKRLITCIEEIKKRANSKAKDILQWNISICSVNNFPTAAGLASSAAGYACLVYALAQLYGVEGDISAIARRGSGSACRSIYGGWVRWHMGQKPDGSDSIAKQIVDENHWPEMRVIILVVNDKQKKYSSTSGMKTSVETSDLIKERAENVVPGRTENMANAIKSKDFETFAKITMQDSNQFHAVCLDTYPPCFYMNDVSREIIETIHEYNKYKGNLRVAYTFDAGPNACLYLLEKDVPEVLSVINYVFPPSFTTNKEQYLRGNTVSVPPLDENLKTSLNLKQREFDTLRYIIYTKVGTGPKSLPDTEHLLTESGVPK